jgi:hypothetical protein
LEHKNFIKKYFNFIEKICRFHKNKIPQSDQVLTWIIKPSANRIVFVKIGKLVPKLTSWN